MRLVDFLKSSTDSLTHSWALLPLTSSEVKANLNDLKVLGKGDFKALLKWRTALREEVCR